MRFLSQFSNKTVMRGLCVLVLFTLLTVAALGQRQSQQGARYGDPNFEGEKINLNVVNADIRDILNYITEQYGVNFVIDKSVKAVPVTVNVSDVPWNIALDSVLEANGLGIDIKGTILRVAEKKVLADESALRAQLDNSRLDTSPLFTEFIRLNYARAGNTLAGQSGSTGVFTGGGSSGNSTGGDAGGGGILPIIKRRLSRRGGVEVDERSNTLIVTDVRQNIDSIRQLVALLDQPEPQVEIEARIVIASRTFGRDLGVQLSAIVADNGRGAGGIFSTLPGDRNNNFTTGNPNTANRNPGAGIEFPQPTNGLGANLASTIFGLTTGLIGTAKINLLLSAAENKGQAKVIATPRVTTLNNRPAQIESGQQIPVVTAQVGQGGGDPVFTTTFVNVPLRLSVTPQITDAGTVVLRVVAENNSVNTAIAINGTPGIDTQRMQTEVLVPNGGTTVVGGALLDNETELRNRTPGLASIPVLGNLFKRRATTRNTNEILFFITPRIYRPDFEGNLTEGKVGDSTRTTTLVQPVPLGNPPSNSTTPGTQTPAPQPILQPVVVQPNSTPINSSQQAPAPPTNQTSQPPDQTPN
jgi:type IV pilus assembly protein PilQ